MLSCQNLRDAIFILDNIMDLVDDENPLNIKAVCQLYQEELDNVDYDTAILLFFKSYAYLDLVYEDDDVAEKFDKLFNDDEFIRVFLVKPLVQDDMILRFERDIVTDITNLFQVYC